MGMAEENQTCYTAYFDGSPTICDYVGIGYVIFAPDGKEIERCSDCIQGDNTRFEELAFLALLTRLDVLRLDTVRIFGDNNYVITQIHREKESKNPHINECRAILAPDPGWEAEWIPRGQNTIADSLAKQGKKHFLNSLSYEKTQSQELASPLMII
jgi:ribonuclease HI